MATIAAGPALVEFFGILHANNSNYSAIQHAGRGDYQGVVSMGDHFK
jgi:hypothetical protein